MPRRSLRGVTLFESLVTLLLLFVVMSSVVSLLQSSLRAMKSQQGRAITEVAFVQELIRRDLADALTVSGGSGELRLSRHDYTVPWQQLLTMRASPRTLSPIRVSYQLIDGMLRRATPTAQGGEALMALDSFQSEVLETDVRVSMALKSGQRQRNLVWSFRCSAL